MSAFFFTPEESTRGSNHFHASLIQPQLQPGRLDHHLADAASRQRVFDLISDLMCGTLPEGYTMERAGASTRAVPPDGVTLQPVPHGLLPLACRPPVDGSLAPEEINAHLARAAMAIMLHVHSHRCRKGGHRGTDADCAGLWPRPTVEETGFHPDGPILARLDVPHLTFYTKALMLAHAMNHVVYLGIEQSRWNAENERHKAKVTI